MKGNLCQDVHRARIWRLDVPELTASDSDLGRAASRGRCYLPTNPHTAEISLFLFSKPHPYRIWVLPPPSQDLI